MADRSNLALLRQAAALVTGGHLGGVARVLITHLGGGCRIDAHDGDAVLAGDATLPCRLNLPITSGANLRLFRAAPLDDLERELVREVAERAGLALENARLRRENERVTHAFQELFIAAGHELRTPLAALKLQLQGTERQLHRGVLDENALGQRLRKSLAQLDRVQECIEQLLDAAALPRLGGVPETVDLAQLAVEVAARHAEPMKQAGCALSVCVSARPIGAWDAAGLSRAVSALLEHALRHGAGQPVELSVTAEGERARLLVCDGGPPLHADELQQLFSPFGRATWEHHFGSTGLQVWRSRSEVAAMGGALSVDSRARRTEYTIELPL